VDIAATTAIAATTLRSAFYLGWPYYWGAWPYYYPYAGSYASYYPYATTVVEGGDYSQAAPASPQSVPANQYWYYCTEPAGYYPYVQKLLEGMDAGRTSGQPRCATAGAAAITIMDGAMTKLSLLLPLSVLLVLGGCVTVPVGPAVRVMPGTGKGFDQFQADDVNCRQYAYASIGGPDAARAGQDNAAANAAVATAIGAAAGAAIGAVTGQAGHGAAIGAGTGLLWGSAGGANAAGYSSYQLQNMYDTAYMQCMYARGNQVPGTWRTAADAGVFVSAAVLLPAQSNPGSPGSARLRAARSTTRRRTRRRRGAMYGEGVAHSRELRFHENGAAASLPSATAFRRARAGAVLARRVKADLRPALHRHLQVVLVRREEHRIVVDVGGERRRLLALEVAARVSSGNVSQRAVEMFGVS
jgi:hypothetical protein